MSALKRKPLVLIFAGLVVGIGAGLIFSIVLFPVNQGEGVLGDNGPLNVSAGSAINETPKNSPTDLASVFVHETASERRLAVYRLLEGRSRREVADLVRSSLSLDLTDQLLFVQSLLFAELSHLAPELSLELVWEAERAHWDELFNTVVEEWASIDAQSAMQRSSELMEPWKSKAFRTILQTRHDSSEQELAEFADSFGASAVLTELSYTTQVEAVFDEPRAAFELVLQADIPDSRKSEMVAVITDRWIERESIDDVSSMLSLVHDVFPEERHHWRLVVSILAASDPKFVWEQLSTLSLDAQKMLNDTVFEVWVKQDPFEAIQALNDTGYMTTEDWELRSLYWIWARAVSDQLPENITLIPEDHRSSVLISVISLKADQLPPNEILVLLDQFSSLGVNTKGATDEFIRRWSRADPSGALKWIEKNLEKDSWERSWKIRDILIQLARVDATKAMEVASQQPAESGAEHAVIGELLRQNKLEQGLSLLPSVPDSSQRSGIYSLTAGYLIAAGRVSEAINLADRFTDEEKLSFFEALVTNMSFLVDVDVQIAIVRGIDEEELRSSLSASILRNDKFFTRLTDNERELLSSFVQEETN